MHASGNAGARERRGTPLPGSRKAYLPGPGGMRVPVREIPLQPESGSDLIKMNRGLFEAAYPQFVAQKVAQ